jgi:hypothetical protein
LQAAERQATIEQQKGTIDQLEAKIKQAEAANEELRLTLSHHDEANTLDKKRTQPQSAAAAVGQDHSSNQKRHKPGRVCVIVLFKQQCLSNESFLCS